MSNQISFFDQLILGDLHHGSLLLINIDILNDIVLLILYCYWEWIDQILLYSIFSITKDSHWSPFPISSSMPISHMLNGCISSTSSWTQTSLFNNSCSSLLYLRYKLFSSPVIIQFIMEFSSIDRWIESVWEHSWRVITPNTKIIYFINMTS